MELEEFERYKRQLPIWGKDGQKKISTARIAIIGLGGLGCTSAYYLTAAGIGKLGLIDYQKVQLSDLSRQILFDTESIGKLKVRIAAERLKKLNPEVIIKPINRTIKKSNIDILKDYNIILDGTDNYETRFLLNDYCFKKDKIFIFAAADTLQGIVSVFRRGTPCLRCIVPKVYRPGCRAILGTIPAILGLIQALEALKIITNGSSSLEGYMLIFNGTTLTFDRIKIKKDRECVCKKFNKVQA